MRCDICRGPPRGRKRWRIAAYNGEEHGERAKKARLVEAETETIEGEERERFREEQRQYRRMEE